MKGFTLVEVLTSLTIGMVLLGSTVKLGLSISGHLNAERGRMAVRGNLNMAGNEVNRFVRGVEPDFMDAHPLIFSPVHQHSHIHGSFAFHNECQQSPDNACLTVFDIRPLDEEPIIYRIQRAEWPRQITLYPIDENRPPGPDKGVDEMSVLLFSGENQTFCVLVASVLGINVLLADSEKQPWQFPEISEIETYEVIHLGFLDVTHIFIKEEPGWGMKLVYQPHMLYRGDWDTDRSRSSYGRFDAMEWMVCDGAMPDRLLLIGQDAKAPALTVPVRFGSREYFREAFCVSWEF